MTTLTNHQSNEFTKLLLLGDSKAGKTGSLVSLVKAGYKLRILDFDNLLDSLKYQIIEQCPDRLDNVEFRTLRDKYKSGGMGTMLDGKAKAWIDSLKMLGEWKYTEGTDEINLGPPGSWGADTILVIDSLTRWCDAAYAFHEQMTPAGRSGEADGRAIYGNAQRDMEKQLASLTSDAFKVNLIVIAHGVYQENPDGTTKIFPSGIGAKLSPKIPSYFPNYIRYKNANGKRTIQLESDSMIDLANSRPGILNKTLPIETGLAEFFAALRPAPATDKPKSVTLVRKV